MTDPDPHRPWDSLPRSPRVALYSHDTVGLGHLRRNLLIAQTLAERDLRATCLMIAGAHETNFFPLPAGIDCLTLPRISKGGGGEYVPARLDVSVEMLVRLRQRCIYSSLEQFEPDLFIVDKVPGGVCGELLPALKMLKERSQTQCVLGLRDILDDAAAVHGDWLCRQNVRTIERFFDAVWVYGDPAIYDPVREYDFPPSVSQKTRFVGYLDQTSRLPAGRRDGGLGVNGTRSEGKKRVVCTVGGGQDGASLAAAFIEAVTPDIDAVVLTGPYFPQSTLLAAKQVAATTANLQVIDFTPEADAFIANADYVIGMAGYNTVCSILTFRKPALLVPRMTPRREQWIRAERLRELGLVGVLPLERLDSESLAAWLRQPLPHVSNGRRRVDLNGLERIVAWVESSLAGASRPHPGASAGVPVTVD